MSNTKQYIVQKFQAAFAVRHIEGEIEEYYETEAAAQAHADRLNAAGYYDPTPRMFVGELPDSRHNADGDARRETHPNQLGG